MSTRFPVTFRVVRLAHKYVIPCVGAAATLLLVPAASAQSAEAMAPHQLSPAASDSLLAEFQPAPLARDESSSLPDKSRSLPDAPSSVTNATDYSLTLQPTAAISADHTDAGHKYPKSASPTDITILPGQTAPHQTVRDKLVGSVRDAVSPFSFAGELISAGYSHGVNGSPNYGTNATAFGQRFGASVARGTSQNLFYEGAMASILREDPRYYQMGSGHPLVKRLVYAGTRPLITRTDGGKTTPNFALLSSYLGAAALTKVYYPQINQGFNQTLQTYGGSIGGAAIGYVVSEFLSDALQIVHLKKGE